MPGVVKGLSAAYHLLRLAKEHALLQTRDRISSLLGSWQGGEIDSLETIFAC